jgi:hypothetical protein
MGAAVACAQNEGLMEHIERKFYPDGTLREEIHYKNNKEHGHWRVWHPNGVLAEEYFLKTVFTRIACRERGMNGACCEAKFRT